MITDKDDRLSMSTDDGLCQVAWVDLSPTHEFTPDANEAIGEAWIPEFSVPQRITQSGRVLQAHTFDLPTYGNGRLRVCREHAQLFVQGKMPGWSFEPYEENDPIKAQAGDPRTAQKKFDESTLKMAWVPDGWVLVENVPEEK